MSFKTFFANLPAEIEGIPADIIALFKGPAGKAIAALAESAGATALGIVLASPQIAPITAIVHGLEGKTNADGTPMTGAQKMADALPGVIALVGEVAADVANPTAALVGGETLARSVIETVLGNAEASNTGSAVVKVLGAAGVTVPTPAEVAAKV